MGKVLILPETPKDPISIMGRRAGICTRADITDPKKNYERGIDCFESMHGRVEEFPNVEIVISGYSARVIREWYTHIGCLPSRLQESTRYIDESDFEFITPKSVEDIEEALKEYEDLMLHIRSSYSKLIKLGVPKEDAANILPLGMVTLIVDKRNVRNFIDMCKNRLCNRAYWEFRDLMKDICKALSEYSEEWKIIVERYFRPKCEYFGYCPESKSCGKYPKKNEIAVIKISDIEKLKTGEIDYIKNYFNP